MTAANTAAKPLDNARPGLTAVECRPSARTALDDSRQPAHSYGSEGRADARRGCRPGPRGVWAVAPAVSTPHCLRGTRQDLPCASAGEPRTLVIVVQLAPATSGRSRSLADTPTRRSGHVEGRSRTDSQADSAGSIPVTRKAMRGRRSRCRSPARGVAAMVPRRRGGENWYGSRRLFTDDGCRTRPPSYRPRTASPLARPPG